MRSSAPIRGDARTWAAFHEATEAVSGQIWEKKQRKITPYRVTWYVRGKYHPPPPPQLTAITPSGPRFMLMRTPVH